VRHADVVGFEVLREIAECLDGPYHRPVVHHVIDFMTLCLVQPSR
jgi:hypothetical protein